MSRQRIALYLGSIALLLIAAAGWYAFAFGRAAEPQDSPFDGQRALADVERQVAFGPRIPGSDAHASALNWMVTELTAAGWTAERQTATSAGHKLTNLVAFRDDEPPQVVLGAHFDTRLIADRDPDPSLRTLPGPGANDGASGVAVLLELARTLPSDGVPTWLIFFDAEDNGRIAGWDWVLGSRAFVSAMAVQPDAMILVDMVGDADLRLPIEGNSDPELAASIWSTAGALGHERTFVAERGTSILDDHVPFIEAGVPAVDIIDIDYAYWHTSADTLDKVSAQSLQVVGDVLWTWLTHSDLDSVLRGN